MTIIYSSEVFPSIIRDFSVGLNIFFCNLGGALSQYVYIALTGKFTPYYLTIECCVVGCVICLLLSVETYQRPLDFNGIKGNKLDIDTTKNTPSED